MSVDITIKTDYSPELYRRGLPYRLTGGSFKLKTAIRNYKKGDEVVGWRQQCEHFTIAQRDQIGWLLYILGDTHLDKAKHIAANLMQSYYDGERSAIWVKTLDGFKPRPGTSLYVFDALFDDDTPYRRSQFYDALQKTNGPQTSAILIGRSEEPFRFIKHIGIPPNLLINTK